MSRLLLVGGCGRLTLEPLPFLLHGSIESGIGTLNLRGVLWSHGLGVLETVSLLTLSLLTLFLLASLFLLTVSLLILSLLTLQKGQEG